MTLNITIDDSIRSKVLESSNPVGSDVIEHLYVKNDELGTVETVVTLPNVNSFKNMDKKFLMSLRAIKRKKEYYSTQNITIAKDNCVNMVTIYNNGDEASTSIFKTFNAIGIMLSTLTIGINEDTSKPTVYLTNSLIKNISRLKPAQQAQLIMYIYSVGIMVFNLSILDYDKTNIQFESYSNSLTINSSLLERFKEFVPSLNELNTINVEEIPEEDLVSIRYMTQHSYPSLMSFKDLGMYTYICNTHLDKDKEIVYDYDTTKLLFKSSRSGYYYIVGTDGKIETNAPLSYIDLQNEMLLYIVTKLVPFVNSSLVTYKSTETLLDTKSNIALVTLEETNPYFDFFTEFINKVTTTFKFNDSLSGSQLESDLKFKPTAIVGLVDVDTVKKSYEKDEYAQELYKQSKKYYDTFNLGNLVSCIKGVVNGAIYSMLFIGESGTGKSTAARVLADKCGIPYVSVNFSVNIEESDLIGTMVPNDKKKSADDPEFLWHDGILTKAVRNGYIVILEEINFARPGVLGKLNSLLDEVRQIDLPTGEIVRAHPNFRIIATCNIAYEGTNRFNKALVNRFEMCHEFIDLNRDDAIKVIKERTGYSNVAKIGQVYSIYESLKKYSKDQNLDIVISIRQLLTIFRQGKYYPNALEAVKDLMINSAFLECKEYQKLFEDSVLTAYGLDRVIL